MAKQSIINIRILWRCPETELLNQRTPTPYRYYHYYCYYYCYYYY